MLNNIKKIALLVSILLLLQACGSSQNNVRRVQDSAGKEGLSLYQQGSYYAATQKLTQAWQQRPGDEVLYHALLDSWLQLDEEAKVWQLINEANIPSAETTLIKAQLAHRNAQCKAAMQMLESMNPARLQTDFIPRYWQLKATCADQINDHLTAALAWIQLDAIAAAGPVMSVDADAWQQAIVRNLIQVPEDALIMALTDPENLPLAQGWIEAAYVNFGADGVSGDDWLRNWPAHPAAMFFLDNNKINKQQKVAVLLPLSGRFAAVASAFQAGMLTAAAGDSLHQNELIFYDTGSQGENLSAAWYSAQENQVDLIIGPLDKVSIEMVEGMPAPTVPVVLLNQSEANYHQFTLSPEGEAEQAAERMFEEGQKQVLIMAANDLWGERMTKAFAQKFVDLGGAVINNAYFQESQNDYSAQLRQVLGLIESQLRAKNLQSFLNINLASEEVVRPDVDAIFLAARPSLARLMIPQLKFHHAAQIPVYSTSHVFAGLNNTQHNRDLQGVRFAISPIELESSRLLEVLPFDINDIKQDKKLYAFGYDAYQLIARLDWMSQVNMGSINGLTGKVSLDFNGTFHRGLSWAQYNNGSVVALEP